MENQDNIIALKDENGNEVEFEVIATLNIKENDYTILLPLEEEEEEVAYIFRIDRDDNGEELLVPVEEDEEFQLVQEAYESLMEE